MLVHESRGAVAHRTIAGKCESAPQASLRVDDVWTKAEKAVVLFGLSGIVVPAQAKVQRQTGIHPEIILNENSERAICRQGGRCDSYRGVVDGAE